MNASKPCDRNTFLILDINDICALSNVVIRPNRDTNDNDFLIFACVSGSDKLYFCFPLQFRILWDKLNLLLILTGWEFVIVWIAFVGCLFARMIHLETSSKMNLFCEMHCIQASEFCRHRPVSKRPSHQKNKEHLTVGIIVKNKEIFLFLNEYLSPYIIDAASILEDAYEEQGLLRIIFLNSHRQEDIQSHCPNVRVYSLNS